VSCISGYSRTPRLDLEFPCVTLSARALLPLVDRQISSLTCTVTARAHAHAHAHALDAHAHAHAHALDAHAHVTASSNDA
jgi:hypothetical protein